MCHAEETAGIIFYPAMVSAGMLMLCLCYFLSSYFISFLTIAWTKEILETTRPIFTKFAGMVGMLV